MIDTVAFGIGQMAPGGIAFVVLEVVTNGKSVSYYNPLQKSFDTLRGQETWIGTFTGSLYADPQSSVSLVGYRTAMGIASSFDYAISGHFAPAS